jgi:hypothetical protein
MKRDISLAGIPCRVIHGNTARPPHVGMAQPPLYLRICTNKFDRMALFARRSR